MGSRTRWPRRSRTERSRRPRAPEGNWSTGSVCMAHARCGGCARPRRPWLCRGPPLVGLSRWWRRCGSCCWKRPCTFLMCSVLSATHRSCRRRRCRTPCSCWRSSFPPSSSLRPRQGGQRIPRYLCCASALIRRVRRVAICFVSGKPPTGSASRLPAAACRSTSDNQALNPKEIAEPLTAISLRLLSALVNLVVASTVSVTWVGSLAPVVIAGAGVVATRAMGDSRSGSHFVRVPYCLPALRPGTVLLESIYGYVTGIPAAIIAQRTPYKIRLLHSARRAYQR